jgi:hypothetical protein
MLQLFQNDRFRRAEREAEEAAERESQMQRLVAGREKATTKIIIHRNRLVASSPSKQCLLPTVSASSRTG